jgi:hypothetical protein
MEGDGRGKFPVDPVVLHIYDSQSLTQNRYLKSPLYVKRSLKVDLMLETTTPSGSEESIPTPTATVVVVKYWGDSWKNLWAVRMLLL